MSKRLGLRDPPVHFCRQERQRLSGTRTEAALLEGCKTHHLMAKYPCFLLLLLLFATSSSKVKYFIMQTVLAFGMPSGGELLVILFFVVIFFGSKKIPELARGLGQGIREFKDATKEIKKKIEETTDTEKTEK